ncbi:cell wall anchor [Mycolicibacterium brisbanense]|uniref:Cell wall anchor n=1 Tax=Mycolicibacterium brisbanense TaxID=146020 RepID=A0A100W5R8_9MYCO|nr:cell wall anchor [Mycolicibacterium brisbanense]
MLQATHTPSITATTSTSILMTHGDRRPISPGTNRNSTQTPMIMVDAAVPVCETATMSVGDLVAHMMIGMRMAPTAAAAEQPIQTLLNTLRI